MSEPSDSAFLLSGNADVVANAEPATPAPAGGNPPKKRGPRSYGFDFGYPRSIPAFDRAGALIDRLEGLGALSKLILKVLINHGNLYNFAEPVYPSEHRISELIGRSERAVRTELKTLAEEGYILRQRKRKGRGRFGVSYTFFTPKAASLVDIPYRPDRMRQGELFAEAFGSFADTLKQAAHGVRRAVSHLQDWERHLRAVQEHELVRRLSLPKDLLFLLERGVRAKTLCRWARELRDSHCKISLVEMVKRRRWQLEQSKNAGAYLCALVRAAKQGKKIADGIQWDASFDQPDRAAEAERRNALIRQYLDAVYRDPNRGLWYRSTAQGDVRVFREDPRTGASPVATKDISWLDEQVRAGRLSLIRETEPDPGEGSRIDTIFDSLREALGVSRRLAT